MRFARTKALFKEPIIFNQPLVVIEPETSLSRFAEEQPIPSHTVISPISINNLIAQNNYRQKKYLELVKQFIDSRCEYSFMEMVPHSHIRDAWSKFLSSESENIKHLNIAWNITPADIARLDNRYSYKRVHICKSCKNKQFSKCCDQYAAQNRTSHNYMIHMRLINPDNINSIESK